MALHKILIVEDSRTIAEEVASHLELQLGFECIIATTCAEATAVMEKQGPSLFLAILDLTLPDAPQGEVVDVARIRRVPSIVFTSELNKTNRRKFLSKDIIDYIIKDSSAVNNIVYTISRLQQNKAVKILVVDDSTTVRAFLKHELKRYMFNVYEASNGKTALKVLERNPDIQLVIMDYNMPEMDGIALTRAIRQSYTRNELAIIGLSGHSGEPLSVEFIKNGANDFIAKPFQREELYCRVIQNIEGVEQFAKLSALGQLKNKFLGMAAHDLRNPINGILGLTNMMLDGATGSINSEQQDFLKTIGQATQNMLHLVNDLLDVSIMESDRFELELEPLQLSTIISSRLPFAELEATRKGIRFNLSLGKGFTLHLDKNRIGQLVDNLLSNAIKFSPSETQIDILLKYTEREAILCVRDEGPGIPEAEQSTLFNSFCKGSVRPTGGESSTGLGLTIVKQIVSAHNGRVWVESTQGKGTTFFVGLPLN